MMTIATILIMMMTIATILIMMMTIATILIMMMTIATIVVVAIIISRSRSQSRDQNFNGMHVISGIPIAIIITLGA
jgi:ABC-type transport system involved in Fe-S cluster assembly fused permease/ATPase subunit